MEQEPLAETPVPAVEEEEAPEKAEHVEAPEEVSSFPWIWVIIVGVGVLAAALFIFARRSR